jgi:hypothetical protein
MRTASVAALFVMGLALSVAAQNSEQTEVRHRIRVNSDLVVLSVTVKNEKGDLVAELHRGDFQILDDAFEQKIEVFSEESLPLSLVILIDKDLKWKEGSQMIKSLRAVAAGLSAQDEASVCHVDMLFYPDEGFSWRHRQIAGGTKRRSGGGYARTAIYAQPLVCGKFHHWAALLRRRPILAIDRAKRWMMRFSRRLAYLESAKRTGAVSDRYRRREPTAVESSQI